jgi:hypothetical protein
MPGMLSEATQAPPSSGPVSQTPPPTDPGAGNSPSGGAAGPGQPEGSQDFETMRDEAIQLVYGERFDQLIKMFETNGAEKFPRSMGIAINTAISELEKKHGVVGPEMAAKIGSDLMVKLLEDIVAEKVVPDVTLEQIQDVLPAALVMYADSHPNVSKEDVQAVMKSVQGGLEPAKGGAQPAGAGPAVDGAATPPPAMIPQGGGPPPGAPPPPMGAV